MTSPAPLLDTHRPTRSWVVAVALGALVAGLALVAWTTGVREAVEAAVRSLRHAGPGVFFVAMAVLPAVGVPVLAFAVLAGPVFGPTLGTGWVIAASLAAVGGNLLLTYWIATRALRSAVSWVLRCFGIPVPDAAIGGAWQTTLVVRLTPGPPFWVQSYLLGSMRVPLWPYLTVSSLILAGYVVALVYGGEALLAGHWRQALAAAGLVVGLVAALQLLRKWLVRPRPAADFPALTVK